MEEKMKLHTELPWMFTPNEKEQMISVHRVGFDPDSELGDETVCGLWGEFSIKGFENAKFIVEACNSYYLLKSLMDTAIKYFAIDMMNCGTQAEVDILITKQLKLRSEIESLIQKHTDRVTGQNARTVDRVLQGKEVNQ